MMGTLGDRIGRRRLLLIGTVVFGLASVLSAFSPRVELLIAARALLGVAGEGEIDMLRNIASPFTLPGATAPFTAKAVRLWSTR
jgi:MFS family permease